MTDTFTSSSVVKTSGISYRQLDYWTTTKLVQASVTRADGSGTRREYSATDLLHILAIERLLSQGFDLRHVRPMSRKIHETIRDCDDEAIIMLDGKNVRVVDQNSVLRHLRDCEHFVTLMSMRGLVSKLPQGGGSDR